MSARVDARAEAGTQREKRGERTYLDPILVQRNHPLQALEMVVLQPRAGTDDHIRNGAGEHDALASGVHVGVAAGVQGVSQGVQGVELAGGDDDDDDTPPPDLEVAPSHQQSATPLA
ncbi:hypothetical protein DFH09DRAFT_1329364 [Mycena vulgaris]|nr:hypothetical protein DFH09DRAFT_1329364 [Mycena vulgaris]